MGENKEPEFEPILPRDEEAIRESLKKMKSEYGIEKLLAAEWQDFLLFGQTESLSLEQIVERYGDALEPKQLQNIKDLINGRISKTTL